MVTPVGSAHQALLHGTMGLHFASAYLYLFVSMALQSALWYGS